MRQFSFSYRRRSQLRDQFQRRSPPIILALASWLIWALATIALYRADHSLLLALLLLGGLTLLGGSYGLLWLGRDLRRERRREAERQQGFAWLSVAIRPRRPLPVLQGGMADPDLLIATRQIIHEHPPQRVLELGSGLSTLVMAYALEAIGQGELVALEDNSPYAAHTRRLLAEHGLGGRARVLDAPLRQWHVNGEDHLWYALADLSKGPPIDLLFVDGPAGYLSPMIRYLALPLLRDHLADDAHILLDDTQRRDESLIAQRWRAQFPELRRDDDFTSHSFAVFRLSRPNTAPS